ncbi:hypothetical protein HA378_29075, partial [Escherichia coli]|nr:hypothetical protein [Escherichia coli]
NINMLNNSVKSLSDWLSLSLNLGVPDITKTEMIDKVTKEREKYYEDRRPEITNTVFDAKFTAFLPSNVMTFGGQYQYSRLKDESSLGGKEVKQSTIT